VRWANALLAISVEQLLGYDCDEAAESIHRASIKASAPASSHLADTDAACNGGFLNQPTQPCMQAREDKVGSASNLLFYTPVESVLQHDGKYVSKVRRTGSSRLGHPLLYLRCSGAGCCSYGAIACAGKPTFTVDCCFVHAGGRLEGHWQPDPSRQLATFTLRLRVPSCKRVSESDGWLRKVQVRHSLHLP